MEVNLNVLVNMYWEVQCDCLLGNDSVKVAVTMHAVESVVREVSAL